MSVMGASKPPTLSERELLLDAHCPPSSGFTPRHVQKLAVNRKPHTMLDIECKHVLRCPAPECVHGHSSIEYRLWLEAGKYDGPFPTKPDPNYNSNVWRNFRKQYGFDLKSDDKSISEVIAAMYPLNVPPPSRVGENTFTKYIAETRLFKDEKFKALAIRRTSNDLEEFRRLRIKSRARNPPLDEQGNILPPENFKKYPPRFITPTSQAESEGSGGDDNTMVDMFGQRTTPVVRTSPHLWKLTAKLKYPEYEKVKLEVEKRKVLHDQKIMKIIKGPMPIIQKVL